MMSTADLTPVDLVAGKPATVADPSARSESFGNASVQAATKPLALNILLLSIASLVTVIAIAFFAAAMYESLNRHEARSKSMPYADMEISKLRAEQVANLSGFRWVNQAEGVLAIPVDRAMQLTIERMNATASPVGAQQPSPTTAR